MAALEQSLEKLRAAAKIHPTDASIFIAIGESCCALAEKVPAIQALQLLNVALDEGFGIALRINSACLDAIIGKAEAHFVAGKSSQCIGTVSVSQEHLGHSMNTYTKAVEILKEGMIIFFKLLCYCPECFIVIMILNSESLLAIDSGNSFESVFLWSL